MGELAGLDPFETHEAASMSVPRYNCNLFVFFRLKSTGSTMPSRFQGRLPPLAREALAEFMATFILVVCSDCKLTFSFQMSSRIAL